MDGYKSQTVAGQDGDRLISRADVPDSFSTPTDYDEDTMDTEGYENQNSSEEDYEAEGREDYGSLAWPLIDYARHHGLTTDYRDRDPVAAELIPTPPSTWEDDFEDPKENMNVGLLSNLAASNGHTTHEKLDVDRDTAEILGSVFKLGQQDDEPGDLIDSVAFDLKDLKFWEPLLSSDPQLDLSRLNRRNKVAISTHGMQSFPEDEARDPGLIAGKEDELLRKDLRVRMDERLDMEQSTMEYIKDMYSLLSLKDCEDAEELNKAFATRLPTPETPPLIPSSPPVDMGVPNGEGMEFEFTSTPEDLSKAEAIQLREKILEQDDTSLEPPPDSLDEDELHFSDFIHPEYLDQSSSPPPRRKRLQDLRVEGPLTPEDSLLHPAKKAKTVSFSDNLQSVIPQFGLAESEHGNGEESEDNFMTDVVKPLGESAIQTLVDEKLDELDTTMRVPVPQIDDLVILQPREEEQHFLLPQVKRELCKGEEKWSGASKVERQLPWKPFPTSLGKVKLDEQFDDGSLSRYLAELESDDTIDFVSLICEPDVLKMLEDDEEEVTLMPVYLISEIEEKSKSKIPEVVQSKSPETMAKASLAAAPSKPGRLDMRSLLERRRKQLERDDSAPAVDLKSTDEKLATGNAPSKSATLRRPTGFVDLSTASGGLANFMNLHGKVSNEEFSAGPTFHPPTQKVPAPAVQAPPKNAGSLQTDQKSAALPYPSVLDGAATRHIVVSSTFLSNPALVRELVKALPGLEFIQRDPLPEPTTKGQNTTKLTSEADITLSPGTGILLTTLQKLKQRPLPGQSTFFGVHDRIHHLSIKYKCLIVLVSEASKQNDEDRTTIAGTLDSRDLDAISEVTGVGSTLDAEISVLYVAGGDAELARWVAACISRYSPAQQGKLLEEETLWERLLRQGGLNPFAAQFILSRLGPRESLDVVQASSEMSEGSPSGMRKSGLTAFVQMTESERLRVFGQAVGERILERVSKVIDGPFIPASKVYGRNR